MKTKTEFKNRLYGQFKNLLAVQAGVLLLCLTAASGPAQTYTILHTFGTNVMGLNPHSSLVQGPDGALYGTTEQGGSANQGQVFKVNPDGSGYTVLKDFTGSDGAYPEAGLLLSGSTLYGATFGGGTNGNGTVFTISTDGTGFAVLKDFTGNVDGGWPYAALVLSGTTLYGTANGGGSYGNGTVFKVNTDGGGFTVLKSLNGGSDGGGPVGALVLSGTTLYGTAGGGGSYGNGTAFKVNTDGSGYTVLKTFTGGSDGGGPAAGLVLSGATLYGTASWGGNSGYGTIFEVNTNGSGFSVLKDFTDYIEGANPYSDLLVSGTTLYGTTPNGGSSGNGTVFKVNTDGSGFTVLKDFTNSVEGAYSYAGLMLSGSTLYGTTFGGGNNGYGILFKVETDGSGYAVVTHFAGGDGANPYGSLVLSDTTFYGTTAGGGAAANGIVFKVNVDGSGYTILENFAGSDGAHPNAGLVLSETTLYGTTTGGGKSGNGVVFKVNTDGTGYTVLKDFTNYLDGAGPNGGLVLSGTTLYGTTSWGGSNSYGTVFKVSTNGNDYTILKNFTWSDGAWPYAGLVLSGTTLYGATENGGSNGYGTIFQVNTDGTGFTVLKNFTGSDGANPVSGLCLSGTKLYGTTAGGVASQGVVFEVNCDGSGFTVLKSLTNWLDGAYPNAQLVIAGTTLYGTTSGGGIVGNGTAFEMGTDGSSFTVLKHFTQTDGRYPYAGLVLSGSTLFGITANGGGFDSGVLFSLSLLPGAPQIQMQPESQTAQPGWTVDFNVVASPLPAPAYQWFFNGDAINGATNYSLQLTNIQGSLAGGYSVVITNTYGSVTSLVATLTVEDPFINGGSGSQYVNAGNTVQFNVDAGGTQPLSCQWFEDGVSLNDAGNISGAQTTTLTLTNVNGGDGGWFFCVVSNTSGSLTSSPAMLVVQDPFINSQPSDQSVNQGDTAEFSVDAGGTQPLIYQWFKDGVSLSDGGNISGAQTSVLTLTNVVSADAGGYSVIISNAYGNVSSTVAQLTVNLATVDSFDPGADGDVSCLAVQADGKILLGGYFATLGGQTRNYLGRLNVDGTLDTTFDPGADTAVNSLAVQADGKILVGGWFSTLGGQTRNYLGRLNANGAVDTTFNTGADAGVHCLAVQPDGKILVGGEFTMLDGEPHNYIGRLNADGTLDTNFNCEADSTVSCLALQTDGKILVGGWFNTLGGQTRHYIGRLNADGTLDTTCNPGTGDGVECLALQPDGKILLGGAFTTLGGQPRNRIARLNTDGTLDSTFNPGASSDVLSLAVQADGKILVGGWFNMLGEQTRNYLGRLNVDGALDTAFDPGADGGVYSIALQPDGEILLGGDFSTLGGQPRNRIGRLNNTESATESLTFDGSTITWLRGGSSPEVWRTSFEVSTNGTDWLDLGIGTYIAGGWQLTGLSAPTNGTLRAIGFVASYGVSTWFAETMTGPPAITVQPLNADINLGSMAVFSVQAGGTPPLFYQWFKDGVSLTDGGDISGAQSPTLVLNNVIHESAGSYSVLITNASGNVTSLVAILSVADPFITTQPADQSVDLGQTCQFEVEAGGTDPFTYQWRKDGVVLTGQTASSLLLPSTTVSDVGSYDVVVTNSYGSVTSRLAVLTVNLALADAFNPGANSSVQCLAMQPDGKILVGGWFNTLGGQTRYCLGRLNADETLDATFNPGARDHVFSLGVQRDGKILVGGWFNTLAGQTCYCLGRLNADGTLDSPFNPGADSAVRSIAMQGDGKILVGGWFYTLGGQTRRYLGRLNVDGTLDTTFNPGANGGVDCLVLQPDGKILVGGSFNTLGGQARNNIGRLNADGTLDTTFNPDANSDVLSLAVQGDGKILVGGYFRKLGGRMHNCIGRLNADGTLDTTFDPSANNTVCCMTEQPDGKILVGGEFSMLGSQMRNCLGRLDADGTVDMTFNPGANNTVNCMALQPDGKIVLGGYFTMLDGQPRNYIGRLVMYAVPSIAMPQQSQTAEDGCVVNLAASVTGYPPPTCQWFFNGNAIAGCTNSDLCLSGVGTSNVGAYTLVMSNAIGAITSAPVMLNVVPLVERRPVPGIGLMGETGASLNVEYTDAFGHPANWLPLDTVSLTNPPQYCFDISTPPRPQRFYRAWQSGTPSVIPSLNLNMVPAITLTGNIGDQLRLDYINQFGPTDAWVTLDTVTLTNTSQFYFDVSVIGQPARLYRIVPVP